MNSSRANDRASSIYPPTISPPDSPRYSDVNSSNPDISPISTNGPAPIWLRPSAIPQPRKQSPGPSPAPTPELKAEQSTPTTSGSGWRDVVKSIRRSPSPSPASPPTQALSAQNTGNSVPTRWDTYSGERAVDGRGKAGAASPGAHPYKGTDPGFGYTAHISGGTNQPNGKPAHFLHVKLRKASDRKELPPAPQEPWRGASGVKGQSGRTATVEPVADKPAAEKRSFPTPAERRARGFFQKPGASGRASPGPGRVLESPPPPAEEKPSALRVMTGALDSMRDAATKAISQRSQTDPVRPTTSAPDGEVVVSGTHRYKYRLGGSRSESPAPSNDYGPPVQRGHGHMGRTPSQDMLRGAYPEHAGPRSAATMPVTSEYTSSPMSHTPASANMHSFPPRKDSRMNATAAAAASAAAAAAKPASASAADDYDPSSISKAFHSMGFINEPRSHWSATTYETSIHQNADSPPATPSMAAGPSAPTPPNETSILNRKRPVPSASNQYRAKPPQRKPTPMQANGGGDATNGLASGSEDLSSLPEQQQPPKPVDRVAALQEKLAQLSRRKASLAAVIHELTNVVQPSSIAYDMASRAEIRKTVEGLKVEQDAVLKEVQEVGIKLHRAIKRRDEEAGGDGGGLWVRRVTVE